MSAIIILTNWLKSVGDSEDRILQSESRENLSGFWENGKEDSCRVGKPERLEGHHGQVQFSIHVSPNVRLIIIPEIENENYSECRDVQIRGVCDYHGDKTNWYIP